MLHGIRIKRSSLAISHLMYVDDLVIMFTGGDVKEATTIQLILEKYCMWSRKRVNFGKSIVYLLSNINGNYSHRIYSTIKIKKNCKAYQIFRQPFTLGRCKK